MPRIFLSLALYAVLAVPLPAAADGPRNLDEAIRYALTHNPELRAGTEQMHAAEARAQAARGAFLPQVGVRVLARRSDNPLDAFADKLNTRRVDPATDFTSNALNDPASNRLYATQLSVELPLYTGGRLAAGVREAGAMAAATRLAEERHRQIIAFRTLHAYRTAQAATSGHAIAADAVAAAREHAETTARLVRQGRIVASDRLTAELNLAAAESQHTQAAHRMRSALESLRLTLGLPAEQDLTLADWEPAADPASVPSRAVTEEQALQARTDLKAQESFLHARRAKVVAARSAFHPQVGMVATESWYDDNLSLDNNSQSIMGVVSLNLFQGGRDYHGLRAARHETDEAEQRLEGLRQTVRHEVRVARSRLTEAQERVRIAGQSVNKAHGNVRLIKQRYGEGRTLLIDLLMAERLLVEARNESLAAALQQQLAQAELHLADGSLIAATDQPSN